MSSLQLRPFQRQFLAAATRPDIDTAVLSLPRGNGKSWLASCLAVRALTPGDPLFRPGTESVLCAASIEQARIVFRFARAELEPLGGYRFQDAAVRIGILHKDTNTRLRVISSSGKGAMGLVGTPLAICDEPGAWEVNGGTLMHDAIETAKGKPGSPLKAVYIGTLAPATGGWWHELVARGSHGTCYVQALQGDPDKWGRWPEIRRCNPLTAISAPFRRKLLEERDDARADSRLKARFLSFRLNVPTADEAEMLLSADDWRLVLKRPVPDREGRPTVAYDLGGGRSWSAAVAIWPNGRLEALAVAPGVPDLEAQEKRDRAPKGSYQRLVNAGALKLAHGLRVQPPAMLHAEAASAWGTPSLILCDRFRLAELQDCVRHVPLYPRVTRWSESSEDIRALRKLAKDGPLSCEPTSRLLVTAALAAAKVKNDDAGSSRLVKRDGTNNCSRDDVAAALTLAAGAFQRRATVPTRGAFLGVA